MPSSAVDVSIIVPTYNDSLRLKRLLDSLATLVSAPIPEVLVVDDASTDDTEAVVRQWVEREAPFPARYLRMDDNGGPGRARNAGLRAAQARVVAFTDSDCVVTPAWLAELVAQLDSGERIGGVAGRIEALSEKPLLARYNIVNMSLEPQWTPTYQFQRTYLVTCNCCYLRDPLMDVGGFPEDLQTPGGEDIAASVLMWKQGWRYAYAPDAVVRHDFQGSVVKFAKTFRNYGYGTALVLHRLLTLEEFHPEWGKRDAENYWDAAGLSPSITGVRSFFRDLIAFSKFARSRGIGWCRLIESIPPRILERVSQSYGWRQGVARYREEQTRNGA